MRQTHGEANDSLGQRDSSRLANQLLVPQDRRVPLQLQEAKQLVHLVLCVKHQLLVVHGQAARLAGGLALAEHGLHRAAPLGQAVPVAAQVEARDGHLWVVPVEGERWGSQSGHLVVWKLMSVFGSCAYLARYHGVDGRPAVSQHQHELGFGEDAGQVGERLQGKRVLVAEARGRLTVAHDHLTHTRTHVTWLLEDVTSCVWITVLLFAK